ncbi:glutamate-5-semialdehyde dehydrogenase [candidate division NPL-UPA2 bacterium]|nr:glutamate-5-semialdehyde dehydrogenase [candidate division NPL-UPA2 bacterium]
MNLKDEILAVAQGARQAARRLAHASTETKNRALLSMAKGLRKSEKAILTENEKDVKGAKEKNLPKALVDRLLLNSSRIESMASGLEEVAALPDPVGETIKMWRRPNGLEIGKRRVPIGVIALIYEARPNVTADSSGLSLKAGNAIILRGGSEAIHSNLAIARVLSEEASRAGVPQAAIQLIKTTDREAVRELLKLNDFIDLIIPRGGESLIRTVVEESTIPVIKHYKGICHTYVDESADLDMAVKVSFNAKVQRPGVCNAMETLLVHQDIARDFLPTMIKKFQEAGVEMKGCQEVRKIVPEIKEATEEDWKTEYLDLVLSVKVVPSLKEAIEHIHKYGSSHSEAIITENYRAAKRFLDEVDAAAVYVNASTRFTDGGEFGLGAEIGISTEKIHARGPMGLEELCIYKYIIYGEGQVRQ